MSHPPPPEPHPESNPIDELTASVTDGQPVDWPQAESIARTHEDIAHIHGLQDLSRVMEYHRRLQRSPLRSPSAAPGSTAATSTVPEQWGHLTLLELASAGANGEVWRAWDVWLQREVALKFLVAENLADGASEGHSSLLDEARALARVRHPGVVAVYGIGEHSGRVGMWMELLHGTTLEAEIERQGSLSPRRTAEVGLALCRALEAVEAAGLVHRDIKPANIVLEPGDRIVLTDFGLGRRIALAESSLWRSSGTPLFMAPELLAGEAATRRSDLYALGVTLRWALTGRCPFRAADLDALKMEAAAGPAASLASERPDAPAALVAVIERSMAPAADARFASAAQLATVLEGVMRRLGAPAKRRWPAIAAAMAALLAAAAVMFVAPWKAIRTHPAPLVRFAVHAPPGTVLRPDPTGVSVSPDGRMLAFEAVAADGIRSLWIRPLDATAARPLAGTERAFGPFWSADSRMLAFFADGKLKKVAAQGGAPETICDAADPRGGSWGSDGTIVFAPVAVGPLCRVSANGGAVTVLTRPDSARGETALRWPQILPGGKHVLFVSLPPENGEFPVHAAELETGRREFVMGSGAAPLCAGDEGLLLARNGRLWRQRFDDRTRRPIGDPVPIAAASSFDGSVGQPLASVSHNGVLVRPSAHSPNTRVVWLDRSGNQQESLALPQGRYERFCFSPDGDWLLAECRASPTVVDYWLVDLQRGQATRFTHGSQSRFGGVPAWSPDGTRIAFSSNREGTTNIYQRPMDAAGEEELLYASGGQFKEVNCWSPDGKMLVFEQADPVTGWDLWLLPLDGERKPIPYLRTKFGEVSAAISPDGKWLAYCSDVTGRIEIYVRSFPDPGAEYRITTQGGHLAVWSRGGKELLVLNQGVDFTVWSVPVSTVPVFEAGEPRLLFRSSHDQVWLAATPDGARFLQSVPAETVAPITIDVDLNWPALAAPAVANAAP